MSKVRPQMGIFILTSGKVIVIVSVSMGVAYFLFLKDTFSSILGKSTPFSYRWASFLTTPLNFTLFDEVCCGGVFTYVGLENYQENIQQNKEEIKKTGANKLLTTCPMYY